MNPEQEAFNALADVAFETMPPEVLEKLVKKALRVSHVPSLAITQELEGIKFGDFTIDYYKNECPKMQQIGREFKDHDFCVQCQPDEDRMFATLDHLDMPAKERPKSILRHFLSTVEGVSNSDLSKVKIFKHVEVGLALLCVSLNRVIDEYEKANSNENEAN